MGKVIDETGNHYSRLLVIEEAGRSKDGHALWKCICICGNETIVTGNSLRTGNVKSCGCLQRDRAREVRILPKGQATFNVLYNSYKKAAKQCSRTWELTKEDFSFLTKMNCHYCGCLPMQKYTMPRCNGSYIYNGVDRVDNTKGYTMDNVVPCCRTCNYWKRAMTVPEFIEHASKIVHYRNRE